MNLSFEEGNPLEPIPLSQNINFNNNNKGGLLSLFGGSNQGTRGGFDMGDITYQDKPIINQSTGEVTGIIRYYSTGAVEQLDREGNTNIIKTLYKGRYEIELYTIPGVSFKVPIRVNLQYRKEQEYKIDDCIAQLIFRHKKEKDSGVYISEDFAHRVG